MAEFSVELRSKLKKAASREEVEALLKADGQELSPDELEDVAGGRDWMKDGCAATVEENSDCWGTDGGCAISNITYTNLPETYCRKCNKQSAIWIYDDEKYMQRCRYCGLVPWGY